MRILHTSDWHIGRTFHRTSTLEALREVFTAMIAAVKEHQIDVVVAAGDIFDSTTPSAAAVRLLDEVLRGLVDAGAKVVMSAGNHDSPDQLGAKAEFARRSGIFILTDTDMLAQPVTVEADHGPVNFYGVPFIEPARYRVRWAEAGSMRSQKDAMRYALEQVRADWSERGGQAIVLAHTFVQGADGASCDSERDIVGGVDKVPVSYFTDFTYAALGHIHGRAELAPTVRYSGAPLHFSFSEANKPRGGWLLELDTAGVRHIDWMELPVPRPLSRLTGTLDELLTAPEFDYAVDHWVSATITDAHRPLNTLRQLQRRFPYTAEVMFEPAQREAASTQTYSEKIRGKSDLELVDVFLHSVRNGEGASPAELELMRTVISQVEE